MQNDNKKNQETIPEKKRDKQQKKFLPGIGIGEIKFIDNESSIINILGQPDEVEHEIERENIEDTKSLYYNKLGLVININRYEGNYEPLRFFPEPIYLEGEDLYSLKEKIFINFIKKIHTKLNIKYKIKLEKQFEEEFYYFSNIGLSVWFLEETVTDICIEKPELEDRELV